MGGRSKSTNTTHYDYSTHEEYQNVQGGLLGIAGDVSGNITVTDGGAVDAAAAVSRDAIRMAESSNLAGLNAAARMAGDAFGLSDGLARESFNLVSGITDQFGAATNQAFGLVDGITDKFGKSSDQAMRLASEHARLGADNTKSALDFAKQIGRADGGASAEMVKYGGMAVAAVLVVMILKSGK